MTALQHTFLTIGALLGLLGVAAGAFGAHLLKTRLAPDSLNVYEVAVRYQMYHALVLVILVAILAFFPSMWVATAGWLFIAGILIFSGTLYAFVFSEIRFWGMITPIGGVLLLLGWLSLLLGALFGRA